MIVQFRAKTRFGMGMGLELACIFLSLACVLGMAGLVRGQTPAQPPAPAPSQNPPSQNKPADQQKPTQKPADPNAFPEDTGNVPVLPSNSNPVAPDAPEGAGLGSGSRYVPALPGDDADPVKSPDDPPPDSGANAGDSSSSSSAVPMDRIAPPPDSDARGRKNGKNQPEVEHQETAKEDETVGAYYLTTKNWRAALSRFESAVVLDPENPDVFWGLAEAERHLGDFAKAKVNYKTVMDYDPDSKHAKEAKKLLEEPEMANAKK